MASQMHTVQAVMRPRKQKSMTVIGPGLTLPRQEGALQGKDQGYVFFADVLLRNLVLTRPPKRAGPPEIIDLSEQTAVPAGRGGHSRSCSKQRPIADTLPAGEQIGRTSDMQV